MPTLSNTKHKVIVLLSGTCVPCREIAQQLSSKNNRDVVALVAGRPKLAQAISEMLPGSFEVVFV
jgi:hypothetical protein